MKKNFPTSMIVVAAVVSFGMVGSQLDLGGLSGQAAGGEAAGCGGDAYYDEDRGQLVDSQGNVLDEGGEAVGSTGGESMHFPYDAHAAGEAMDGQSLVTIISPMAELAELLAEDSQGEAVYRSFANVSVDGRYAIVGFGADDYAEYSQVQLLRNDNGQWTTIVSLSDDRRGFEVNNPILGHVEETDDDTILYFSVNDGSPLAYSIAEETLSELTREETETLFSDMAEAEGYDPADDEEFAQYRNRALGNVAMLSFVQERVQHSWLGSFVAEQFGPEVEYRLNTSMNNQMLVALSNGQVLAIEGCDIGNTPINAGGELVCRTCQEVGGCDNPLNKTDMLDLDYESRVLSINDDLVRLRELNRLVDRPQFTRLMKGGGGNAHSLAEKAVLDVYDNGGCTQHGNGLFTPCSKVSGGVLYIRGSTTIQDWIWNLGSLLSSGLGWGVDANIVINAHGGCGNLPGTIAGHSRGGAIAGWIANQCGKYAVTFGAPSTGQNVRGERYVHDWDPVPMVGSSVNYQPYTNNGRKTYEKCSWGRCSWKNERIGSFTSSGLTWPWRFLDAHLYGYTSNDNWSSHKW